MPGCHVLSSNNVHSVARPASDPLPELMSPCPAPLPPRARRAGACIVPVAALPGSLTPRGGSLGRPAVVEGSLVRLAFSRRITGQIYLHQMDQRPHLPWSARPCAAAIRGRVPTGTCSAHIMHVPHTDAVTQHRQRQALDTTPDRFRETRPPLPPFSPPSSCVNTSPCTSFFHPPPVPPPPSPPPLLRPPFLYLVILLELHK